MARKLSAVARYALLPRGPCCRTCRFYSAHTATLWCGVAHAWRVLGSPRPYAALSGYRAWGPIPAPIAADYCVCDLWEPQDA